ncbi:MAG TPA: hypothetical protein VFY43_03860 [Candidatus Limnocylindria bacterium]|nr:hypothetical protein [Candidatus Limnocylindria bacterium]
MNGLRFGNEIRWLFQTALLMFLVTIGLGMARGIGLVDFESRNQTLTHLHSGTIGWVTLGILASVLWLYGGREAPRPGDRFVRWSVLLLVVSVPLYLLAWWTGNLPFRAVSGTAVLLGIVLLVGWVVREAAGIGYRRLTTPRLGAVIGLVTLVIGSTLGVLLQVQYAANQAFLPEGAVPAHAETQVSAYLILVAMSLIYWQLHGDDRTRRGTWMVWLFFAGGAIIAISLLANQVQGSAAYIPLDLAAFVLFLTLAWRSVLMPGWFKADSKRHFAVAIPFAFLFLGIFIFLIVGFAVLQIWKDFSEVPDNLIPASEHPLFVGMVTNILFGMLLELNRQRRTFWPWADHVVFWGVSLGALALTLTLLADQEQFLPFVTPVLGLSILTGIVTHFVRLSMGSAPAIEPAPGGVVGG